MNKKKNNGREVRKALVLISQIGINLFVVIGISLYIGNWIDNFFNTVPAFTIIFIIFGVIAAGRNIYRIAMDVFDK